MRGRKRDRKYMTTKVVVVVVLLKLPPYGSILKLVRKNPSHVIFGMRRPCSAVLVCRFDVYLVLCSQFWERRCTLSSLLHKLALHRAVVGVPYLDLAINVDHSRECYRITTSVNAQQPDQAVCSLGDWVLLLLSPSLDFTVTIISTAANIACCEPLCRLDYESLHPKS